MVHTILMLYKIHMYENNTWYKGGGYSKYMDVCNMVYNITHEHIKHNSVKHGPWDTTNNEVNTVGRWRSTW